VTVRPEPNVDALEAEAIGALEKLRSAGRTSDILKVWCDDARDAVGDLAALAYSNTAQAALLHDAMDALEAYAEDEGWGWDGLADSQEYRVEFGRNWGAAALALALMLARFRALTGTDA
jgi:hypothetical protein